MTRLIVAMSMYFLFDAKSIAEFADYKEPSLVYFRRKANQSAKSKEKKRSHGRILINEKQINPGSVDPCASICLIDKATQPTMIKRRCDSEDFH